MLWQPRWTVLVAAGESLLTLVLLILSFGSSVVLPTLPDDGPAAPGVTLQGVLNFLLSGTVAYIAWWRAARELERSIRGE